MTALLLGAPSNAVTANHASSCVFACYKQNQVRLNVLRRVMQLCACLLPSCEECTTLHICKVLLVLAHLHSHVSNGIAACCTTSHVRWCTIEQKDMAHLTMLRVSFQPSTYGHGPDAGGC